LKNSEDPVEKIEDSWLFLTRSAARKPRLVGADKGRNKNGPFPYREAPPCGREASLLIIDRAVMDSLGMWMTSSKFPSNIS
jgi:hypothetical protein